MPQSYVKDPQAKLDYVWDWAEWLEEGETIAQTEVTASAGLTLVGAPDIIGTGTQVRAWLSGGTAGLRYEATCAIVTTAGRTDERTLAIYVEER